MLLALASPADLEVLGITTVAGNVPLSLTQSNARKVCELAGRREVAVYAGCSRPLIRPLVTAETVHGPTGLDGVDLPDPQMPLQAQHGVDFLIETLLQAPQPLTVVALGPLTNVGLAIVKEPRILAQIEQVVLMGGSATEGNVTPAAEFNIYVDPHAAHIVFSAGIPVVMLGLNLTHQVITTPDRLARIRSLDTPVARAAAELLQFYGHHDIERYGLPGGPLHDPCVIAYLLRPELFSTRLCSVQVEIYSPLTLGQTVVDRWGATSDHRWVTVVETVDVEGFYQLLIERLARL